MTTLEEREANYQRHVRRQAAKKRIRAVRDRNDWLWWGWVQVLVPQMDGLPFELEPNVN